jgi:hypothetical protein
MAIRNNLPLKKNDPIIKLGDTGEAVEAIQQVLQSFPGVASQLELLNSVQSSEPASLTSSSVFGRFEKNTRQYVADFQDANKEKIKKAGNLSEQNFQNERGSVGYATWKAMSPFFQQEEEVQEQTQPPPPESAPVLPDPPPAKQEIVPLSTHYVKTKDPNSRLALRYAPAYVRVGKNAWQDKDKKGDLLKMMLNDTLLRVIDWGVGYRCEWAQVEITDSSEEYAEIRQIQKEKKLYCFAEFIQPLSTTAPMLPINCLDCAQKLPTERTTPFPDWTVLDECEPFYDIPTCRYYTTVTLPYTTVEKSQLPAYKKEAVRKGVEALCKYYNKPAKPEDLNRYLNAFKFADEPNQWHLDERPNSQLKMLVSVPGKYFDAVPQNSDNLEDIMTAFGNLPNGYRTVHFYSNTLRENIETVASRFEEYGGDFVLYDGEIPDFDFFSEAIRLREFVPALERLLKDNGYELREDEEDTIEIGFEGPCFNAIYVLINEGPYSVPMRVGIDCFLSTEPVIYERIMGYVFYLGDMVEDIRQEKKPWTEFVQTYACPQLEIEPSKPSVTEEEPEAELPTGPVKTTAEKDREDELLLDLAFKLKQLRKREGESDFVGDDLLSCFSIPGLLDRINTLEDTYSEIIDKVDIKSLASIVARRLIRNTEGLEEEAGQLTREISEEQFVTKLPTIFTISLPDNLPTEDIMSGIGQSIESAIRSALTSVLIGVIKSIFSSICDSRLEEDDIEEGYGDANISDGLSSNRGNSREKARRALRGFNISDECLDEAMSLFDDLSDVILPSELCSLLDGAPSKDLTRLVKGIIQTRYSCIYEVLNNTAKIEDFFSYLGKMVDPKYCEDVKQRLRADYDTKCDGRGIIEDPNSFCQPEVLTYRNSLLEGKMDSDSLDELLEQIKERSREKLRELAKILNDDLLKNVLPPIVDDPCNRQPSGPSSIIPRDPESVDFLTDKINNVLFDSVQESFRSDVRGFKTTLIQGYASTEDSKNPASKEDLESAHNAQRATVGGGDPRFNTRDTQILLKDPLATGTNLGRRTAYISPELRENLRNTNNFKHSARQIYQQEAEYVWLMSLPNPSDIFKKLLNGAFANNAGALSVFSGLLSKLRDPNTNQQDFLENRLSDFINRVNRSSSSQEQCPEPNTFLPEQIKQIASFASKNFISNKTIAKYSIPRYSGEKKDLKDIGELVVTNPDSNSKTVIEMNKDLLPEVKAVLQDPHFSFSGNASAQQEVFASYITGLLSKVVSQSSKRKLSKNSDIYLHFRDQVFHEMNEFLMSGFALQTLQSPLFRKDQLENLNLLPKPFVEEVDNCPPDSDVEEYIDLLDIQGIKDKVSQKYEQLLSTCREDRDITLAPDETEESALVGVVEAMVRVHIIEAVLEGIFVFSEFKTQDILGDTAVVKFFVEDIKRRFQLLGNDYYETFLQQVKKTVSERGDALSDPSSINRENPNAEEGLAITNPAHPKNQSGEIFLEYLIKENLNDLSPKFEDILGSATEDINTRFLEEWVTKPKVEKTTVLTTVTDAKNHFRKVGQPGLVLERYVRKCDTGGEVSGLDYLPTDQQNVIYGMRLTYFPETGNIAPKKNKPFEELEFSDEKTLKKERSYRLSGYYLGRNKPQGLSFNFIERLQNQGTQDIHLIPLVQVEEETARPFRLTPEAEEEAFNKLRDKLIRSQEYTLLFKYCFPLSRFLAINSIYNIVATRTAIPEIESAFDETKSVLKNLQNILLPSENEPWWNKPNPDIEGQGGNAGIMEKRMGNITTSGCHPSLIKIALATLPIFIKGMAERFDPSYALIKQIHDVSGGRTRLDWSSVPLVLPINIFGPFGFGPPLGFWGMIALSLPLLSGERRRRDRRDAEIRREQGTENCET